VENGWVSPGFWQDAELAPAQPAAGRRVCFEQGGPWTRSGPIRYSDPTEKRTGREEEGNP